MSQSQQALQNHIEDITLWPLLQKVMIDKADLATDAKKFLIYGNDLGLMLVTKNDKYYHFEWKNAYSSNTLIMKEIREFHCTKTEWISHGRNRVFIQVKTENESRVFGLGLSISKPDKNKQLELCLINIPQKNAKIVKVSCGLKHNVFLMSNGEVYTSGSPKPWLLGRKLEKRNKSTLSVEYSFIEQAFKPGLIDTSSNNRLFRDIACTSQGTVLLTNENSIYFFGSIALKPGQFLRTKELRLVQPNIQMKGEKDRKFQAIYGTRENIVAIDENGQVLIFNPKQINVPESNYFAQLKTFKEKLEQEKANSNNLLKWAQTAELPRRKKIYWHCRELAIKAKSCYTDSGSDNFIIDSDEGILVWHHNHNKYFATHFRASSIPDSFAEYIINNTPFWCLVPKQNLLNNSPIIKNSISVPIFDEFIKNYRLNNPSTADVKVRIQGPNGLIRFIHVHSAILKARCPTLISKKKNRANRKTKNEILLAYFPGDYCYSAVNSFFRYLYHNSYDIDLSHLNELLLIATELKQHLLWLSLFKKFLYQTKNNDELQYFKQLEINVIKDEEENFNKNKSN